MHTADRRPVVLLRCDAADCGHYTSFTVDTGDLTSDGRALTAAFWRRVRCGRCERESTSWTGVLHPGLPERRDHASRAGVEARVTTV